MTTSFLDLGVRADLVAALESRGITDPFPIQEASVAQALGGRDIAARAPTGSGKTLAFGLPLIARVGRGERRRPRGLVLTPTRELAAQICRDLQPLGHVAGRRLLTVYGGTSIGGNRKAFDKGVDIVVACPGRLLDLLNQRIVDLSRVDFVVIDEADRMADMGFLPDVRRLLDATADSRQVLLFSATLDGDVGALVRAYQHDPLHVAVENEDGQISKADHAFHTVERSDRAARLVQLLRDTGSTIVFCRTRHGVDRVAKHLDRAGIRSAAIHGGHQQSRRERALGEFTSGRAHVLVATDVAARGLHIDDVAQVVHFDIAADAKTYVHRSGRTARAGASGSVVSFVGHEDAKAVAAIRRELGLGGAGTAGTAGAAPQKTGPSRNGRRRPHQGASRHGRPNEGTRTGGRR